MTAAWWQRAAEHFDRFRGARGKPRRFQFGLGRLELDCDDAPLEQRSFPEPSPEPGGAVLEMLASEVCGTDVHLHHEQFDVMSIGG